MQRPLPPVHGGASITARNVAAPQPARLRGPKPAQPTDSRPGHQLNLNPAPIDPDNDS